MKLAFALLAGLSVSAFGVRNPAPAPAAAENAAAPAAPALSVDAVKVEPYVLKNRSSFGLTDEARPPFWPIGMKKRAEAAPAPTVKAGPQAPKSKIPVLKPEYFKVTGVLLGQPPLATLNGRSFSQGEMVPVVFEGQRIDLALRRVLDGGVQLAQGENVFFVPLHRPALGEALPTPDANSGSKVLDLDASGKKTQR